MVKDNLQIFTTIFKKDDKKLINILIDENISKIILGWNNGISDYSYLSLSKKYI